MTSYARASQLAGMLQDAGINAVADPRSATPPCVLFTPPRRVYDLPLPAYTAQHKLVCLVPGPGASDAWAALDDLLAVVVDVLGDLLDGTTAEPGSYQLAADQPALPAYTITLTEGLD